MADALFVPTSPRGAKSTGFTVPGVAGLKRQRLYQTKLKGRITYRKLLGAKEAVAKRARKYAKSKELPKNGIGADYLLLQKVDIRRRTYMRLSQHNIEELASLFKGV